MTRSMSSSRDVPRGVRVDSRRPLVAAVAEIAESALSVGGRSSSVTELHAASPLNSMGERVVTSFGASSVGPVDVVLIAGGE